MQKCKVDLLYIGGSFHVASCGHKPTLWHSVNKVKYFVEKAHFDVKCVKYVTHTGIVHFTFICTNDTNCLELVRSFVIIMNTWQMYTTDNGDYIYATWSFYFTFLN